MARSQIIQERARITGLSRGGPKKEGREQVAETGWQSDLEVGGVANSMTCMPITDKE